MPRRSTKSSANSPRPSAVTCSPGTCLRETNDEIDQSLPDRRKRKILVSEKKLAANRANSKLSPGPTTTAGKNRSRFNAVKHGLTARFFPQFLQPGSPEWENYSQVRQDLYDYYQPVDIEVLLVEKLSIETVRVGRCLEMETGARSWESLVLFARYQSSVNSQLVQLIRELERLQAARREREREESAEGDSASAKDGK